MAYGLFMAYYGLSWPMAYGLLCGLWPLMAYGLLWHVAFYGMWPLMVCGLRRAAYDLLPPIAHRLLPIGHRLSPIAFEQMSLMDSSP